MSTKFKQNNITFTGMLDTVENYSIGDLAIDGDTLMVAKDNGAWQAVDSGLMETLEDKVQRLESLVEKLVQQLAPELGV